MPDLDHTPNQEERTTRLKTDLIAWLATVRPDGRPHLVPVWFWWHLDELIVIAEPGSQKVKNLKANPRLSIALDDSNRGTTPIMLEGTATLDPVSPDLPELVSYFAKYRETMAVMNWSEAESRASHSMVIRIRIDRFLTF